MPESVSRQMERAILAITLLASAVPAWLVVRDRWIEKIIGIKWVDETWWKITAFRSLAYPRYFLIIFILAVLTALIVFLWRHGPTPVLDHPGLATQPAPEKKVGIIQHRTGYYLILSALAIASVSASLVFIKTRIPGWELLLALVLFIPGRLLMDNPLEAVREYVQARGRYLLDASLFAIAVCAALYAVFGETKNNFIFFLILIPAGVNFLRHRDKTPLIFWVSIASLLALTWKINGWEYVVIGDEYSFYYEVRNILDNRSAWELVNTTFNGNFVYGTHPYLSSYIHDLFMKMFGNHNFGWRFSNPFLVACSLPFFYYSFRAFVAERTALIATALLGTSHYLLSFSKIGYNNLQALFAMSLVLAAFVRAMQKSDGFSFSLLGLSVGFCFYVYPAALYIILLPILGLIMYLPPTNKESARRWWWMSLAALLLIYPLIAQPEYWQAKIPGTFLYTKAGSSAEEFFRNAALNIVYSAFSFLYIPEQTHYVSTGYMDPVSSVFLVIGGASLARLAVRRNRSALFLSLGFLVMLIAVGATHGRVFPTATRMFLLLPWFALFTVLGLEWVAQKAGYLFRANNSLIVNAGIGLIIITNLFQAYVVDIRNMAHYHTLGPLFIRTVREINTHPEIAPKYYAFVSPPDWNIAGMEILQKAYCIPESPRQLLSLPLEGRRLNESASGIVSRQDVVVIVKTDMDAEAVAQVDAQLAEWGRSMCEIKNEREIVHFQLWHSGDLGWLCQ